MDMFTITVGAATITGTGFAAWQVLLAIKHQRQSAPLSAHGSEPRREIAFNPDEHLERYVNYLIKANSDVDPRGVMEIENHATLKLDEIYISLMAVKEEHRGEAWIAENQRQFEIGQGGDYAPGKQGENSVAAGK